MNLEFHYYAIHYLCLRAGMEPGRAKLIAMSSQHVDNATRAYEIDDGSQRCSTEITQNYLFWDESIRQNIYLPFHFVPGDTQAAKAARDDKAASRWTVTPDSPLSKELLVAALRTGSPFRIGIALHAYADCWAHQNFSGRLEAGNAIDPSSPLPPAGHLQALRAPDDAAGIWTDPRLSAPAARVENRLRFLDAARKIYRYLRTSMRLGFEDEDFALDELNRIWSRRTRGDAASRAADYAINFGILPYDKNEWLAEAGIHEKTQGMPGYDKLAWLKSELARGTGSHRAGTSVRTGGRFAASSLRFWNDAAREHRKLALDIFSREGLL